MGLVVKIVLIAVGTLGGGLLIATPTLLSMPQTPRSDILMGDDFFRIRRQALALFPRGSRLSDASERLVAVGFRCEGVPHKIANVNADSLLCDSHGRGYPTSPTMTITVLARNGLVSDFEVANILQRADADTPEPPPPSPPMAAGPEGHGETAPAPGKAAPSKEKTPHA